MPGISDPGHQVIAAALAAGVPVHPLPGPCAAVTALVGSGLPTERFLFVGFLPPKSGGWTRPPVRAIQAHVSHGHAAALLPACAQRKDMVYSLPESARHPCGT